MSESRTLPRADESRGETAGLKSRQRGQARSYAAVIRSIGVGLIFPVCLLAAWAVVALRGALPDQILPAPWIVWDTLLDGIHDGSLTEGTLVSVKRVAEGFALGAVVGLSVGMLMGLSQTLHDYIEPSFLALSQVPILGWMPIAVLVVGLDESLKVILIGWSAFIPIVLNTTRGVRDVPRAYTELGRVLSFSPWSKLSTIVLPSAAVAIFTGVREGIANSWHTLVGVELVASSEGLGYLMSYGRQLFQLELVLAAMAVISMIGLLVHLALSAAERYLLRGQLGLPQ